MPESIRGLGQKQKERIVGVGAFCRYTVPGYCSVTFRCKKTCFVICVTEGKAASGHSEATA